MEYPHPRSPVNPFRSVILGAHIDCELTALTEGRMHDIMSDMKTFTVRDLDRQPAKVLKACDTEGAVRIKSRSGRTYTMRPENGSRPIRELPDFEARLKAIFPKPVTRKHVKFVDRLLAGE